MSAFDPKRTWDAQEKPAVGVDPCQFRLCEEQLNTAISAHCVIATARCIASANMHGALVIVPANGSAKLFFGQTNL
jgi:hypothetical protein